MSQKVIWIVVAIIVVVGGLWYFGVIPGMTTTTDQSAAAANSSARAPSVTGPVTAAQGASASLRAAGKDEAKVQTAQAQVRAAIGALADLYVPLKLAVQVSATNGNDMGKATAALTDFNARISSLQSAPLNAANAAKINADLDAAIADLATINTALTAAKK